MSESIHFNLPQQDTPGCDFCVVTEPAAFDYPTNDVQLQKLAVISKQAGGVVALNSRGWWCACEACHELIRRGDRDGLAERSVRHQADQMKTIGKPILLGLVRHMHDQFWKSREGEPYRHDLTKVPYAETKLPIPLEVYCHECRYKSPIKGELYPNLGAHGPCAGCGRQLGYTEDQRA